MNDRAPAAAGLTLIELMVSLVIVSICVAATLTFGAHLAESFREQRRAVQVQRAARVSLDILSDAIRNASAGVPSGNIIDLIGCTTGGSVRVVNDDAGPDTLEVIYASGGVVTSIREAFTTSSTTVTVVDASELRAGDYAIVTDSDVGALVEVLAVTPSGSEYTLTITDPSACASASFPATGFPPGSLLLRARAARFSILDDASVGDIPTLMIDPDGPGPLTAEPMAEGIEDLQVAVGVDSNGDGTLTDTSSTADEWHYNIVGDAVAPLITAEPWRALRITLVARSAREGSDADISTRPAAEDRSAAVAADPFRRRLLSTTVEIRNLRGSP